MSFTTIPTYIAVFSPMTIFVSPKECVPFSLPLTLSVNERGDELGSFDVIFAMKPDACSDAYSPVPFAVKRLSFTTDAVKVFSAAAGAVYVLVNVTFLSYLPSASTILPSSFF